MDSDWIIRKIQRALEAEKLKERMEEARKSAADAQKREPNGYSSAYWRGRLDGLIVAAGIFGIGDI